jgi:hypothetical protein
MSSLASHKVLQAVRAALIAGNTSSGSRVATGRFHPVADYPFTRVRHLDETVQATDDDITWPARRLHTLRLDVDVLLQLSADLDTALSAAALKVLQVLEGTPAPLAPLPVSLACTGIRYQATGEGAASTGIATVSMEAQFTVSAADPATPI